MIVDGILIEPVDEIAYGYVVTGYVKADDDPAVTAAGLLANARPEQHWRARDGWVKRQVILTSDGTRAVLDIPDAFGRLFTIAEILAERGEETP